MEFKSVANFICGFVIAWPVASLLPRANEWETALKHAKVVRLVRDVCSELV